MSQSVSLGSKEILSRESSVESESTVSEENVFLPNKSPKRSIWRPNSLANILNQTRKKSSVLESSPEDDPNSMKIVPRVQRLPSQASVSKEEQLNTIVYVVIVEAKDLPNVPSDGGSHGLYCKIRLGSETLKSKTVSNSNHPVWQERLQFHRYKDNLLRVSVWDKGKQKNFMGSCVLDLSYLEKERTHEIWQTLDDGFGIVHLSVTLCNIHTNNGIVMFDKDLKEKHALLNLNDWTVVGELQVKVMAAKGLGGKPYCTLEVDNEKVRTQSTSSTNEATWNKNFVFKVYDVTSTLDVKVYDSSILQSFRNDVLGRVSIPLLRINNGEMRWYALKDRSKRNIAKGNCPRVLLQMSLYWNPIKASVKLFKPKVVKFNKKSPKFEISLVYKNIEFVRDVFDSLLALDEGYKRLFEWDDREICSLGLVCWLLFWHYFQLWAAPLLLLTPFLYFLITNRHHQERSFLRGYGIVEDSRDCDTTVVPERSITGRLQEMPEMTITITQGIQYLASLSEKLYNLATFKVPFLSYLTMILLVAASMVFYLIPFNYIMIIFGIYKFSRKYMNPDRVRNNDLVDFFSRIPDTEELNNWKELNVPEPSPMVNVRKFSNYDAHMR